VWREHLGLPATPPPDADATTLDEATVLVNAAIARGDAAAEQRQRAKVASLITRPMDLAFSDDLVLRGLTVTEGAATVVTLVWQTGPAFQAVDADFLVRSKVLAPPPLWVSRTDHFEKEIAPIHPLRMSLWKPGRLYAQTFVAMRRVGTERFEGLFTQRAMPLKTAAGADSVELFTLR
jgi:hypothetical protein